MHEYSIAKNLAYIIFDKVNKEKPKKVNKIVIVVGEASGVEKEFLEHSLREHILKNTICEYSELVFEVEKPKIKCNQCKTEYTEPVLKCICGGDNFDVVSGKDVFVKSIEVE